MKSSSGSCDSSVTQLLKLKVSAGLVWLVPRVSAVLLAPRQPPLEVPPGGQGRYRVTPQPTYPRTPSLLPLPPPTPGIAPLTSADCLLSLCCPQNLAPSRSSMNVHGIELKLSETEPKPRSSPTWAVLHLWITPPLRCRSGGPHPTPPAAIL